MRKYGKFPTNESTLWETNHRAPTKSGAYVGFPAYELNGTGRITWHLMELKNEPPRVVLAQLIANYCRRHKKNDPWSLVPIDRGRLYATFPAKRWNSSEEYRLLLVVP